MKPTWFLAFKIFIVLFWITMLFLIIEDFLFRNYKLTDNINLNQTQFDALVMLCFNIGIDGFKNSSVVKIINGEQASYKTLEDAWKAWNKSQGNVMQGLNNRRNAEYKLYSQGIYEGW